MVTIQYLAGFFDAEGTIYIQYRKGRKINHTGEHIVYIFVTNTYKPTLLEFSEKFGGNLYDHPGTNKPCYRWQIGGLKASKFLKEISPYLLEKKRKCLIALQLQSTLDKSKYNRWHKIPQDIFDLRENLRIKLLKN
jgi:hypothetical protein